MRQNIQSHCDLCLLKLMHSSNGESTHPVCWNISRSEHHVHDALFACACEKDTNSVICLLDVTNE